MRRIDKILLAVHQPELGRVELRASLLGPELDIGSFDVIAVKRASAGMPGATTAFSHVRVAGSTLNAVVDGQPRALGPVAFPAEFDHLWTVEQGSPADVIAATAERIGADLTLLSGSGRPSLPQWIRPSRNADVVRLCRGAVLLVHTEPAQAYRTVVVATDFSRASLSAARTAALVAPSARFVFVHAGQLPDELVMRECELPSTLIAACRERHRAALAKRLEAFIKLFLGDLPTAGCEVGLGRPHQVIAGCARRHAADLVVVGRGAAYLGARLSCAKVMQKMMDDPACDLLIGPDGFGDDRDRRQAA